MSFFKTDKNECTCYSARLPSGAYAPCREIKKCICIKFNFIGCKFHNLDFMLIGLILQP